MGSSNRTFMELKYQPITKAAPTGQGSNRTFMELKLYTYIEVYERLYVLIVPLWN